MEIPAFNTDVVTSSRASRLHLRVNHEKQEKKMLNVNIKFKNA